MLTWSLSTSAPLFASPRQSQSMIRMRSTRPSVLDLRFTGDPWIVQAEDGSFELVLGNMTLNRIQSEDIDLPSMLQLLEKLRLPRRCTRKVS